MNFVLIYDQNCRTCKETHDFSKAFHVFSITWDETSITWAMDDVEYFSQTAGSPPGLYRLQENTQIPIST